MGCKFLFSWLLFILGIFEASSWRASRPLNTNLWLFHGFAKHSAKLTKLSSVACCSTMASLLNAASISPLQQKLKARAVEGEVLEKEPVGDNEEDYGVVSVHHVGILCENLETSLDFYQNILGLKINEARPHDKLPYRGAWLRVGSEMIHLMELPNPDPLTGRPAHGGRDRHTCIAIRDVSKLKVILDKAGIPYTLSRSGRPAIFTRDPDANALEFTQVDA